jgi:polyhydroxyalkanoate synthesis regulator phasin
MIIKKEEFKELVIEMMNSFVKETEGMVDASLFDRITKRIEIFIDRYEINSEKEIIGQVHSAVEQMITRLIKL